ncbi:uncharacterized protein DS421_17g580880 [Arachis hypogaea]|nr:uncharacterized protein DS421_17g580880 [Arachis hypogaea]
MSESVFTVGVRELHVVASKRRRRDDGYYAHRASDSPEGSFREDEMARWCMREDIGYNEVSAFYWLEHGKKIDSDLRLLGVDLDIVRMYEAAVADGRKIDVYSEHPINVPEIVEDDAQSTEGSSGQPTRSVAGGSSLASGLEAILDKYTQILEAQTQESQQSAEEGNGSMVDPNALWQETVGEPYKNHIYLALISASRLVEEDRHVIAVDGEDIPRDQEENCKMWENIARPSSTQAGGRHQHWYHRRCKMITINMRTILRTEKSRGPATLLNSDQQKKVSH